MMIGTDITQRTISFGLTVPRYIFAFSRVAGGFSSRFIARIKTPGERERETRGETRARSVSQEKEL